VTATAALGIAPQVISKPQRLGTVRLLCIIFLALMLAMAIFGPYFMPYSPTQVDILAANQPPSSAHWLGTDALGRDIATLVVYGARWSLIGPAIVVAAAALGWWGARNERVKPILAGAGLLLAAAGTLAIAAFRISPGEHAAETVRALVAAAERADLDALRAQFADDASMHYGSLQAPGDDLGRLMRAAEALRDRRRIESNAITELSIATASGDRGIVMLGCRTEVVSGYGAIPTRWWIEVRRMPDGRWLIDRLAWLRLLNQAPERGAL